MSTTTSTHPAAEVRDLRRVHHEEGQPIAALAGVSWRFAPGRFTAVMGPSGSGKSTLLHCLAGLDRPSAGQVLLGDTDLGVCSERERTILRRERIGVVFQAFNLVPSLTAAQNVELPARLAGRRLPTTAARDALARVGLADRGHHRPDQLSGGQQQRVALARAVLTRPEVVLADEPTGALDSTATREVLALLRELVDADGRTVVMVTHDPVAAATADEVLVLADGRVVDHLLLDRDDPRTPALLAARTAGAGA